jgi:Zn-dependent oligopeptidase
MTDKAIQSDHTKRYLPEKAWASLSKEEREKTDRKKKEASKSGKQFVSNTKAAKAASKKVRTPKKK